EFQYLYPPYSSRPPYVSQRNEGVAEDREAGVPVDVKENGIGGPTADSQPVARSAMRAGARGKLPPLKDSFQISKCKF
ncbi:hypothetical protein KAU04_05495, partial [bacterium]|nr:hypothetical protein [bacterium]